MGAIQWFIKRNSGPLRSAVQSGRLLATFRRDGHLGVQMRPSIVPDATYRAVNWPQPFEVSGRALQLVSDRRDVRRISGVSPESRHLLSRAEADALCLIERLQPAGPFDRVEATFILERLDGPGGNPVDPQDRLRLDLLLMRAWLAPEAWRDG